MLMMMLLLLVQILLLLLLLLLLPLLMVLLLLLMLICCSMLLLHIFGALLGNPGRAAVPAGGNRVGCSRRAQRGIYADLCAYVSVDS